MDSSINSSTIPFASSSTDAAIVPINRATFMATYIPHQEWSLPDSIIYYISKNPSSAKVYGKLIQCCKYFLIRNPPIDVVVVNDLELRQRNNHLAVTFDGKRGDLTAVPSKVWLTNEIYCFDNSNGQNSLSVLIPKICQSNIKELYLNNTLCSINDLKFLGSKCEFTVFTNTVVMNQNTTIVVLEEVFQIFPNVTAFEFNFGNQSSQMVTPSTVNELIKIPHFSNLHCFQMTSIPETFDIDVFYAYMKKNKKTIFYLRFCNNFSDGYRNRLQAVVDEILATGSHDYKVPFIYFANLDHSTFYSLLDLYSKS